MCEVCTAEYKGDRQGRRGIQLFQNIQQLAGGVNQIWAGGSSGPLWRWRRLRWRGWYFSLDRNTHGNDAVGSEYIRTAVQQCSLDNGGRAPGVVHVLLYICGVCVCVRLFVGRFSLVPHVRDKSPLYV